MSDQELREEYARLVDELGGPTAVSRALGGQPTRETVGRRATGTERYGVGMEQVYALRYLVEHPEARD